MADNASSVSSPFVGTPIQSARRSPGWIPVRRRMLSLTALCAGLVIAADVLFYRETIGWTLGIFAALLTISILIYRSNAVAHWPGRLIVLGIIGLCLTLAEHPGPLRIMLTMIGIGCLACMSANGWTPSVLAWAARGLELLARCFFQLPLDLIMRAKWLQRFHRHDSGRKFLVNWAVPVLLSVLFISLFALANPIISKWLGLLGDSIKSLFTDFSEYISISRVGLWLLVGFLSWELLRGRGRGLVTERHAESLIFAPRRYSHEASHTPLIVRCLLLFNLVFAVQMMLDLITVLSNGATLPAGMTYSHYAHRGAYPLVATALLAAAFVLAAFPTGLDAAATSRMKWARRLVYLWIAQNILLVCSAAWRLGMYIEAFGLTRLRIAAGIWIDVRMRTLAVGAALAALLSVGCGQKGPLYLPDQTGEVVTRPTQTPEAPPPEQPPPKDKESERKPPPQT